MQKYIYAFVLTVFLGTSAHAGLLIEPYVGMQSNSHTFTYKTGTAVANLYPETYKTKNDSSAYGGRLGYKILIPWIAVDGVFFNGELKEDERADTKPNEKNILTATSVYATLGFDLPILLRVWGGYGIYHDWKSKEGADEYNIGVNSYKVGVGLTPLPFISLNFEMFFTTLESFKLGNDPVELSSETYGTNDFKMIMYSMSVPFDI